MTSSKPKRQGRTADEWLADGWAHYDLPGGAPTMQQLTRWATLETLDETGVAQKLNEHWPEAQWTRANVPPNPEETKLFILLAGQPAKDGMNRLGQTDERMRTAGLNPQPPERTMLFVDPPAAHEQHQKQFGPVLEALLHAYANRPRDGEDRKADIIVTGRNQIHVAKRPALASMYQAANVVGELRTITVEGRPYAAPTPTQIDVVRRKVQPCGQFDAFPSTLDSRAVGDIVLQSLAEHDIDGRSTVKSDSLALSELVFPLVHAINISAQDLLSLLGWKPTAQNIKRLAGLLRYARHMEFDLGDGLPRWMYRISDEPSHIGLATIYSIGAGAWWANGSKMGESNAWRLSSGLLRPRPERGGPGLPAGYWGMADRFIAGVEAALQWGPTSGKGKQARIPFHMRPDKRGGPGPNVFIPAWKALQLAGEPVTEQDYKADSRWRHRYAGIRESLKKLGYVVPQGGGETPAGGSIEVVRFQKGGYGHQAGIWVRASAQFIEAFRIRGRQTAWDSLPVSSLIENLQQ